MAQALSSLCASAWRNSWIRLGLRLALFSGCGAKGALIASPRPSPVVAAEPQLESAAEMVGGLQPFFQLPVDLFARDHLDAMGDAILLC